MPSQIASTGSPSMGRSTVSLRASRRVLTIYPAIDSSVKFIGKDFRRRIVTVDASGEVRIHDPSKQIVLKHQCAGNTKKVIRFNSTKDKIYFISAHDRSIIVEVDIRSLDMKARERRFKYGKIIDFAVIKDVQIVALNKDGWVMLKDFNLEEAFEKEKLKKYSKKKKDLEKETKKVKSDDEDEAEKAPEYEDSHFQLQKSMIWITQLISMSSHLLLA